MIIDKLIALLGFQYTGQGDLAKFQRGIGGAESKLQKFARVAKRATLAASLAVGTGFGFIAKSVMSAGADYEAFVMRFEHLLGSKSAAADYMEKISEVGVKSAKDINDVREAAAKLRSSGIQLFDEDKTFENILAAGQLQNPLKKAKDIAEAITDAANKQTQRLKDTFNMDFVYNDKTKGWDVLYNIAGKQLVSQVEDSREAILKFLTKDFAGHYKGQLDKIAGGFKTQLSNVGDYFTKFYEKVAHAGVFDKVADQLGELLNVFENTEKSGALDDVAKSFSDFFSNVTDEIGITIKNMGHFFQHWEKFSGAVKGTIGALGFLMIRAFPITSALLGAGYALNAFVQYSRDGTGPIANLKTWFEEATSGADGFKNALADINAKAEPISSALNNLNTSIAQIGNNLREGLTSWIDDQGGILGAYYSLTNEIDSLVSNAFAEMWANLDMTAAYDAGVRMMSSFWSGLLSLFGQIKASVSGLFSGIKPGETSFGDWQTQSFERAKADEKAKTNEGGNVEGGKGILSSEGDSVEGGKGILSSYYRLTNKIDSSVASLVSKLAKTRPTGNLLEELENQPQKKSVFLGDLDKMLGTQTQEKPTLLGATQSITKNDNRDQSKHMGDVVVNVQEASQAPAAVGEAVKSQLSNDFDVSSPLTEKDPGS